ncbi:MAG: hypothetical protein LQ351_007802 [Letrouitia transgressa]|nr:MAG: hypothetical protein LQ351_007802 [Letrouitia transgressa]
MEQEQEGMHTSQVPIPKISLYNRISPSRIMRQAHTTNIGKTTRLLMLQGWVAKKTDIGEGGGGGVSSKDLSHGTEAHADIRWPSPSTTTADTSKYKGTLSELCGFGGFKIKDTNSHPSQWYRFIIPIFLHAGIIHIGFNLLLQMTLGREMEQQIGSLRFLLVYLSSGIFGFVLGGNFAAEGIASTGASGSLFGVIALMLLDLLYHWGDRRSPWVELAWIIFEIVFSFALGLLPGLDNFSHIGGFLMGLVLGICLLHSPDVLRRRVGADDPPYSSVQTASKRTRDTSGIKGFAKEPVGFFKGRKPLWWVWWLVRAGALIGVLIGFIVLLRNFYKRNPTKCHWCKYLTCIDIKGWCDIGNFHTENSPSKNSPRAIFIT